MKKRTDKGREREKIQAESRIRGIVIKRKVSKGNDNEGGRDARKRG